MKKGWKVLTMTVMAITALSLLFFAMFALEQRQNKQNTKSAQTLAVAIGEGSSTNDFSGSDPHFDGGYNILQRAVYPHKTAAEVRTLTQERLEAMGYQLTCPGGSGTLNTEDTQRAQEIKSDNKCGISGNRVDGDVWFVNIVDSETILVAMYGF